MPYITTKRMAPTHQVSFEEILRGEVDMSRSQTKFASSSTVTRFVDEVNRDLLSKTNINGMIGALASFNAAHSALFDVPRARLYHTFHIPKRSGGLRRIDAPLGDLMDALCELRDILQIKMGAMYHTSAYAYVEGRSTVDAIEKHRSNDSKWFLKTDFKDFFGSTTKEFLMGMLALIFPFSEVVKDENGKKELEGAIDLCFLNGGLPQGTPISPMLTNLMMIPIDHRISNDLVKDGFVYTRYADDIQISHKHDFDWRGKCMYIDSVLAKFNAPFKIKNEKTRYGSSSGRNWNLGVMLNKDGSITVGRKRKERLKAMLYNYLRDHNSGVAWDKHDVQVMAGELAYIKMVEPEYVGGFITWFNNKYNTNIMYIIREDLRRD